MVLENQNKANEDLQVEEQEQEQEQPAENLSPELVIEEIIEQEKDIPVIPEQFQNFSSKKVRERCEVCFSQEELFDSEEVSSLLQKDYKHYLKYKRFNKVSHFNYNQEPFSYMYEKKCWTMTAIHKFNFVLRNVINPLNSAPFSCSGKCAYFEFETLYSPQKCGAYYLASYKIARRNLERFARASTAYNVDTYDDMFAIPIPDSLEEFDLADYLSTGKEPRLVDIDDKKTDDIPTTSINRNDWPSEFLSLEDRPTLTYPAEEQV